MNRRIGDLQSPALPLGYGAVVGLFLRIPISACVRRRKSASSETTSSQNESFSFCKRNIELPCVGRAGIFIFRNTLLSKLNPWIQFCFWNAKGRKSASSEAISSQNESFSFCIAGRETAFSIKAAASERLSKTPVYQSETVVSLGEEKHTRPA